MNLEKPKLNPNSVNDRELKKKPVSDQSMRRRGGMGKEPMVNPREIPTTIGYKGPRIRK